MGKVLVEKLLRHCPKLNRLYLIIRTKKGTDPSDRIKEFMNNALFKPLLEQNQNAFDRVVIIPGDMSALKCGMSDDHIQLLEENVSVVFHSAASVRFDDSLSKALKLNVRGTYELLQIAKRMKKLEVFEYVSTTYSNAHMTEMIEEKVYPSHQDYRILLKLIESGDDDALDLIVDKVINPQPNTYTFSKSLAENIVSEASNELPAVIVRPSVVIPVMESPVQGWTDNLNGVIGVTTGVSKGVLRVIKCMPDASLAYIPVDRAINGLVAAAYAKRFNDEDVGLVVNEVYNHRVQLTFSQLVENGIKVNEACPMENYIWYPFMILTENTFLYHLLFFLLQIVPALLLDLVLALAGKKRILLKLNIKIYNAVIALTQFTIRPFTFANQNFMKLQSLLLPADGDAFFIDDEVRNKVDLVELMITFQGGVRRYVFNESDDNVERNRKIHQRLYYIDRVTRAALIGLAVWKIPQWVLEAYNIIDRAWMWTRQNVTGIWTNSHSVFSVSLQVNQPLLSETLKLPTKYY
ncbi:Male sterility protein [Nesidiocoris tenuis]|uniref:Fatty acyl-CoA reductase n=1 Tax=Nesidiocoris tenuis TaxID=355587 RepID=A0ABN7AK06_9HEMI|nr:Male sterility protein [Nesidiocoris tenuis]